MTATDPSVARARLLILLVGLGLYLLGPLEPSWEAHDEGLYVSRARLMVETGNWVHPFAEPHHKTPGFYWVLATLFSAFGANEWVSRLPSGLAVVASMLLIHEIGRAVGLRLGATVGALAFGTMPLVILLGHLARPDAMLVAMALGVVLAALHGTEAASTRPGGWAALLGVLLGLMALLRGPAAGLYVAALVPFLAARWREGGRLPLAPLAAGLGLALLPLLLWFLLAWRQEPRVLGSLLGFTTSLVTDTRGDGGPLYYLWTVPLQALPWSAPALLGGILLAGGALPQVRGARRLLLWSLPIVLLVALSFASSRLPHYALGAYPAVALLAGFCAEAEAPRLRDRRLMRVLLGVGAVLLAGGAAGAWSAPAIGVTLLTLGAGLLLAAGVSLRGRALGWPGVLVAGLGAGAAAGTLTGLLGNPNPALKAFLGEPAVAEALAGPVPMLGDLGKPGVLIRAYGPLPVPILTDAAALVPGALLWIDPDAPPARPFETLAETEGAALVRLGG